MYDLPNHIVRLNGEEFKIDFNIESETIHAGKRKLQLTGYDQRGNTYSATGRFEKDTYLLLVTDLLQT